MDIQLTHLDEYKMRHDEIIQYIQEIYRTQLWGAIVIGYVYTWLILNKRKIPFRFIWFIPSIAILICAFKCLDLTIRINHIGKYLQLIEEVAFGGDVKLPGYEHFKLNYQTGMDTFSEAFSWIAWGFIVLGSFKVSQLLSAKPTHNRVLPNEKQEKLE